jgi:arsenate reductase-like glutaredoxin family protein
MANKSGPTMVMLYVVTDCPLCEDAREWLTDHRIIYVERDVKRNFGALRAMYELTRQRLVPVFETRGEALVRPTDKQLAEFLL